jgi:hypothetical protein
MLVLDGHGALLTNTGIKVPPWDDCIVMQSTGLVDQSGVEIFEGDILMYQEEPILIEPPEWRMIDAFMVHCRPGLDSFRDDYSRDNEPSRQIREGQVIGNIHQNPELLEVK